MENKNDEQVKEQKENLQAATKVNNLVAEGCKAYGIDLKYLFNSRIRINAAGEKEAVIVTNGGAKVFYKKGDEPEPLDPIRVDGIIRKKMKPLTGKKKK